MQKTNYLCPILQKEELRPGLFSMTVESREMAAQAAPGQFLHISCGEGRMLRRPISICDVEGDGLRFVFEVRGEGTKWLSGQNVGDVLDILGPLGHGFTTQGVKKALFVGGGIGNFPLLLAARKIEGEADGVLGFKNKALVVMEKEFTCAFSHLVIATDDGSYGQVGLVTEHAQKLLQKNKYDIIYSCGPGAMLKQVAALAEKYNTPCEVSLEQRMGCGIGACLVCACKIKKQDGGEGYLHVCKDGPVFLAQEVVFDD